MVAEVTSQFGTIDVLVNNAGIIAVGPSEVMTREDYAYSLNVHFWAAFNTVAAVRFISYNESNFDRPSHSS